MQQHLVIQTQGMFATPYVDSSVFIAHVKGETNTAAGGRTRKEITSLIIGDAEAGKYRLSTSTLTIAEVRRLKNKTQQLTSDELEIVRKFFENEFLNVLEVNREIAELAQTLGAQFGIGVIDAVHLATAA